MVLKNIGTIFLQVIKSLKIATFSILILVIVSCAPRGQAFYLSLEYSGSIPSGSSYEILVLKENNEFYTCKFKKFFIDENVYDLVLTSKGNYEIKKDTLRLRSLDGEIDHNLYLLNGVEDKYESLSLLPSRVYDLDGKLTDVRIRGNNKSLSSLNDELFVIVINKANKFQ